MNDEAEIMKALGWTQRTKGVRYWTRRNYRATTDWLSSPQARCEMEAWLEKRGAFSHEYVLALGNWTYRVYYSNRGYESAVGSTKNEALVNALLGTVER